MPFKSRDGTECMSMKRPTLCPHTVCHPFQELGGPSEPETLGFLTEVTAWLLGAREALKSKADVNARVGYSHLLHQRTQRHTEFIEIRSESRVNGWPVACSSLQTERYINKFVSMPKQNPPSLAAERGKEGKTRAEEPFENRHQEKERDKRERDRNREERQQKPKQKKVASTSPRPPSKSACISIPVHKPAPLEQPQPGRPRPSIQPITQRHYTPPPKPPFPPLY